jgi:hypothetical protein
MMAACAVRSCVGGSDALASEPIDNNNNNINIIIIIIINININTTKQTNNNNQKHENKTAPNAALSTSPRGPRHRLTGSEPRRA